MSRFKPGDVLLRTTRAPDAKRFEVGIAQPAPEHSIIWNGDSRIWAQWTRDGEWHPYVTWVGEQEAELHPDPEPIWASYCAWKLSQ